MPQDNISQNKTPQGLNATGTKQGRTNATRQNAAEKTATGKGVAQRKCIIIVHDILFCPVTNRTTLPFIVANC